MTEIQPARNVDAARRRAERIRIKARTITEQYESLRALIDEAERNEDHLALGYASWTAYLADLFGDEPLRLPRDERIPMSKMLTEKGMSTRAVGAVLGASDMTVRRDISGATNVAPADDSTETIDPETGEILDGPTIVCGTERGEATPPPLPQPAPKVTGLDGKTYTRPDPKPAAPKRRALTDQFFDAAYDLNRRIESVRRLADDDRFASNKEKIAQKHLGDLIKSRDLLQQVIEQLS